MDERLRVEISDLIQKHHQAVNALVREVLRAANLDVEAVEFDLEMGQETPRVVAARRAVIEVFGGDDPYSSPPFLSLPLTARETPLKNVKRVKNRAMKHVANLEKMGVCDKCGATFSKETYTWSEPPCTEVEW